MAFPSSPVHSDLLRRHAAVCLDIIVIGASIGGLSAAYNLKQAGHNVRVLEKSDGEVKIKGGLRVPPNMSKLLQHWGLGDQLMAKAVQCPRITFLEGATGNFQSELVYHEELMKEFQAETYGMHLVIGSGVRIDYNALVVDVNIDEPFVVLESGRRINTDMVVGADGTFSLAREKIVGHKEAHKIGPYTTYSSELLCAQRPDDEYVVHIVEPHDDASPGWEKIVPLSKLNVSQFEDRVQRLLALATHATETLHVVQEPIPNWYSDSGKVVLIGNAVHTSCPSSTNAPALAMEDGATLGSLFSRLQSRNADEALWLLRAYQELREDRCVTTVQSDIELVIFSTLPEGPARDERDEGFRMARKQESLDWENSREDILRGAWDEFRGSFGYDAYDATDNWWVDWGVMLQRMTAIENVSTTTHRVILDPLGFLPPLKCERDTSQSPGIGTVLLLDMSLQPQRDFASFPFFSRNGKASFDVYGCCSVINRPCVVGHVLVTQKATNNQGSNLRRNSFFLMFRTLLSLPSHVMYHLWTAFLFTKSDIKTTVIPITSLAVASAPLSELSHLPHIVFWIWFHVLQFDVSNQTLKPEEDEYNKRDRPLPSKRITWRNARILRWILVPACCALSSCYSKETVYASIALCIFTYVYDEMEYAAGHWLGRNVVNAMGFMSFEVGACLIAGANRHALDNISVMSVLCSAGIFVTTIQAQDFKDTEGDRLVGRKTLPIVAPTVARPTLMLALAAWSIGLSALWGLSMGASLTFNVLALSVGIRFGSLLRTLYLRTSGSLYRRQSTEYLSMNGSLLQQQLLDVTSEATASCVSA
ncbi:hypothetical protein EW145_g2356 [Phellinidium pouzarii]|uniref:FAD-binding domain-containing protein n=1 Tax=Phellinidium pouzarii TaxID=167371 RepID=A0A4S4LBD9_9AGAM|nr:hypothetical protein EW145_g2356 [Phellinidium pouzarii]